MRCAGGEGGVLPWSGRRAVSRAVRMAQRAGSSGAASSASCTSVERSRDGSALPGSTARRPGRSGGAPGPRRPGRRGGRRAAGSLDGGGGGGGGGDLRERGRDGRFRGLRVDFSLTESFFCKKTKVTRDPGRPLADLTAEASCADGAALAAHLLVRESY